MSIYGTAGSGTYSVSYPSLDSMMTALKDNTSGSIYASTLRNAVLTLYTLSSTSSVLSSSVIYTSNTASTVTVGGLVAGTDFSTGQSIQQILDTMLHPYVAPTINYFNLSIGSSGPYSKNTYVEYGAPGFNQIFFEYSISQGSVDLISLSNNISISSPTPGFNYNLSNPGYPSPKTLATQSASMIAITADTDTFILLNVSDGITSLSYTASIQYQNKFYWGSSVKGPTSSYISSDLTSANGAGVSINGELGSILTDTKTQTLNGIDGGTRYLFFGFPSSFGTPSFITNGLPNTAFTMQSLNFTNLNSYSASYSVWVMNTAQNSPITLFQIN
jgi:hypothetical protein